MLDLLGPAARYCDGITRRSALKIGTFAFGATSFTLADVLRAEAASTKTVQPSTSSHKSIINIYLAGGPPHQDLFDLKMEAPAEIRGEMKPIQTVVPGLQICEVFPRLAKLMDRCVVVRSITGAVDRHDPYQCTTGFLHNSLSALGGRPSIGSVMSKLLGPVDPSVPPFVGLAHASEYGPWSEPGRHGFLGPTYAAFRPNGPDLANMKPNPINQKLLKDRRRLLEQFDTLKRDLDANGSLAGMDASTERALNVLVSSQLMNALDLSQEDPKVRDRYGDGKPYQYVYDGVPTDNMHFLLARRLIQSGVRCVTIGYGRWDSHGQNFKLVRDHGAKLDQALSALIWDLEQHDMLDDTLVVVWGEFGRTPRINGNAGRDHWPQVSCALMAGGGLKTGQVLGSTNRLGEYAKDRPVSFADMFATIYKTLGIDPATTTILDPTGRPQHLTEGTPIKELV